MSAQELITQHLALWTGSVTSKSTAGRGTSSGKRGKIELTGIKKLRELILELAVRGKLVEQDPNDEPASVLLERIAEEKARLIKAGKIKKPKKLPEVSEEENIFDLPRGWAAIRYGDCTTVTTGKLDANAAIDNGKYPFFTCSRTPSRIDTFEFDCKAVLLAGNGDFNVKMYAGKFNAYQRTYVIRPICISLDFLYHLTVSQIERITENNRGSAIPYLKLADITTPVIYLPPVNEQYRIVEKVDELMALCDRLEQQVGDQLEAHEVLVDTLLDALTRSADATEVAENWARIAEHFDILFTTEASIDKLKQTILQLAVMGRLVEQSANDEPASVLLANIKDASQRLVSEKTIKKPKLLEPIGGNIPYEIPSAWQWEKLGNFTLIGTGATPSRDRPDYYSPPEHPWVTSGETSQAYILDTKERVSSLAIKETNISIYPAGTLIVAMYGQGKTRGQISELKVAAGTNQACAAVQTIIKDISHRKYIKLCFIKLYDEIREGAAGGAQPNLNTGKIANTLIPLPPLEEQQRIVEKIDELMALCDRLKTRLGEAGETRTQLAEALVEQAVQ